MGISVFFLLTKVLHSFHDPFAPLLQVAQIKHAIELLARGDDLVFATGKAARAQAREERARKADPAAGEADPEAEAVVTLKHEFSHLEMNKEEGCADDAWSD